MASDTKQYENTLKYIKNNFLKKDCMKEIQTIPEEFSILLQYHIMKALYNKKYLGKRQENRLNKYIQSLSDKLLAHFWHIFLCFNYPLAERWYNNNKKIRKKIFRCLQRNDIIYTQIVVNGIFGMTVGKGTRYV